MRRMADCGLRIAKVALLILFFYSLAFAAEAPSVKEMELQLQAVRAQAAAAEADFERGRAMAQAGPALMRDAQRRFQDLAAAEKAIVEKIEELKKSKVQSSKPEGGSDGK